MANNDWILKVKEASDHKRKVIVQTMIEQGFVNEDGTPKGETISSKSMRCVFENAPDLYRSPEVISVMVNKWRHDGTFTAVAKTLLAEGHKPKTTPATTLATLRKAIDKELEKSAKPKHRRAKRSKRLEVYFEEYAALSAKKTKLDDELKGINKRIEELKQIKVLQRQ